MSKEPQVSFARKLAHAALCILAAGPLLLANFLLTLALWLYVTADRVRPESRRGNCWSFAAAQVSKRGGYLSLRPLEGATRLFIVGKLYHAAWMPDQPSEIEQTEPLDRYKGRMLLWRWPYFQFSIHGKDEESFRPWSKKE